MQCHVSVLCVTIILVLFFSRVILAAIVRCHSGHRTSVVYLLCFTKAETLPCHACFKGHITSSLTLKPLAMKKCRCQFLFLHVSRSNCSLMYLIQSASWTIATFVVYTVFMLHHSSLVDYIISVCHSSVLLSVYNSNWRIILDMLQVVCRTTKEVDTNDYTIYKVCRDTKAITLHSPRS